MNIKTPMNMGSQVCKHRAKPPDAGTQTPIIIGTFRL